MNLYDPRQLFVTNAISRADIASDLNGQLDNPLYDRGSCPSFVDGDARLTNEVCQKVANWLGDHDDTDSFFDEAYADFLDGLLKEFGVIEQAS